MLLRAGALPASLDVVEERTVDASLGADSIRSGLTAGIVAGILVVTFMVVAYGLWGVFANVSLVLNIILIFGASKLPELARGSGQALRIFKAETKGLRDDDTAAPAKPAAELNQADEVAEGEIVDERRENPA